MRPFLPCVFLPHQVLPFSAVSASMGPPPHSLSTQPVQAAGLPLPHPASQRGRDQPFPDRTPHEGTAHGVESGEELWG
jgi:hypothetical protein